MATITSLMSMGDKIAKDIFFQPLYYLAMVLSISGAYLTSGTSDQLRTLGFAVWILSNFIIGAGFYKDRNWPMVATFIFYEIMNVRGVFSNW
jgi:hypothetical protein